MEYDRESPFGGKLKQLFDHKSFMFSRNLKGEIARSSVDIRDLAVLFSIKDPLRLGDIDGNIFQSYGGIEEMIHSYVHEHSSYGGLNGLVPGGPRAAEIFETLYTKVISGQEHIDGELQRRIRARAVMRLYAAIVRNGNKQDEKGSGVNPTGTAKVTSDENTHDAVGVENSAQSQVVFTSVALNPRVITPDTVLSDLLFASGLSVGVATLKSLHGTAFYEQALRNVFDSLIGVFSATLRSVQ